MFNKKYKAFLFFFIIIIILFFIIYKIVFYTPPLLDHGTRNFVEQAIDFLMFGWHFTKASIYSDYLNNYDNSDKELGNAGWYRKKYIEEKFEVNGKDLFSVLEIYKSLEIKQILEELYIFLIREKDNDIHFLREAAEIFMIRKNWKMVSEAFSLIIDSNPDDVIGNYYLGLSYLNLKKFNKANYCFKRVTELKPDFADAYYRLGLIAEKEKNLKRAKSLYEKAINILPNHLDSLKALKK